MTAPPAGNEWLHEIKYDGYRAMAAVGGGRVRIFTRSGQDWTKKFAQIAEPLQSLDAQSALLDGEIVALDDDGRSKFGLLQQGLKEGKVPFTYFVFDLLSLNGHDLRKDPLDERKERLHKLLASPPDRVRYSEHVVGHGDEVLAKACGLGLEGIVSKRADSPYQSRRTKSWLKIKCTGNDEFVIGGYRRSTKKGRAFASLLLGEYVGKKLHYRGRVGTGFDEKALARSARGLPSLRARRAPSSMPRAILPATRDGWSRSSSRKSPIRRRRGTGACAILRSWACAATSPQSPCNRKRPTWPARKHQTPTLPASS